jgi:hypothetical protein
MEAPSTSSGALLAGFATLLLVVLAILIIYYGFSFFYGTSTDKGVVIEAARLPANQGVKTYTNQAPIYEGGEYTVNMWVYIGGWSYKQGTRKHIFELGGPNFATLLLALGSYTNSLSVRVDTVDASGTPLDMTGMGLSNAAKDAFFKPLTPDASLDHEPSCDLAKIDMQRWIQVTVVLNGKTCDVYLDGKLERSCVLPSYFKVDPTGHSVKLMDRGGFDGYISTVSTYNYSLNPAIIYNMYMAGPSGPATNVLGYFTGLFKKQ